MAWQNPPGMFSRTGTTDGSCCSLLYSQLYQLLDRTSPASMPGTITTLTDCRGTYDNGTMVGSELAVTGATDYEDEVESTLSSITPTHLSLGGCPCRQQLFTSMCDSCCQCCQHAQHNQQQQDLAPHHDGQHGMLVLSVKQVEVDME